MKYAVVAGADEIDEDCPKQYKLAELEQFEAVAFAVQVDVAEVVSPAKAVPVPLVQLLQWLPFKVPLTVVAVNASPEIFVFVKVLMLLLMVPSIRSAQLLAITVPSIVLYGPSALKNLVLGDPVESESQAL